MTKLLSVVGFSSESDPKTCSALPVDTWRALSDPILSSFGPNVTRQLLMLAFAAWLLPANAKRPELGGMLAALIQQGLVWCDGSGTDSELLTMTLINRGRLVEEEHLRCCWDALESGPAPALQVWPDWARTLWQQWTAERTAHREWEYLTGTLEPTAPKSRLRM